MLHLNICLFIIIPHLRLAYTYIYRRHLTRSHRMSIMVALLSKRCPNEVLFIIGSSVDCHVVNIDSIIDLSQQALHEQECYSVYFIITTSQHLFHTTYYRLVSYCKVMFVYQANLVYSFHSSLLAMITPTHQQ